MHEFTEGGYDCWKYLLIFVDTKTCLGVSDDLSQKIIIAALIEKFAVMHNPCPNSKKGWEIPSPTKKWWPVDFASSLGFHTIFIYKNELDKKNSFSDRYTGC